MNILTAEKISKYRQEIEDQRRLERALILCSTADVERLLDEVEASRLKIEQLSEKCADLRIK